MHKKKIKKPILQTKVFFYKYLTRENCVIES